MRTTHHFMYPESAVDLGPGVHLVLVPFKPLDLQWVASAFSTGELTQCVRFRGQQPLCWRPWGSHRVALGTWVPHWSPGCLTGALASWSQWDEGLLGKGPAIALHCSLRKGVGMVAVPTVGPRA